MSSGVVLVKGIVGKIGSKGSFLKNERFDGDKVELDGEILDHQSGIEYILGLMISKKRGVITLIMEKEEIDFSSLNTLINKHSSLLGISGISSDMREIASDTRYIVEHHTV